MEYSRECHCGSTYGNAVKTPKEECNMLCPGDHSYTCGASLRLDVHTSNSTSDNVALFLYLLSELAVKANETCLSLYGFSW